MDENKMLLEEILKEVRELRLLDDKLQADQLKKQGISEYNRNLTHEWENTDEACRAKERKCKYELRQTDLEERETDYLDQQIAGKKNQESLKRRKITIEKHMSEAVKKLEGFQTWMRWDKQTVNDFLGEMVQKEDDEMTIVKYVLQDERRIKSLTLDIEKLELAVMRKCKSFNTGLMETTSAEIALAKTRDNLVKVDMKRGQLDQQCTNTRKQLQQRNKEMLLNVQQMVQALQNVRPKKEILAEKKHVCEKPDGDNTELERKLGVAERQAVKQKQELREQENVCSKLEDELACVKAQHDGDASHVKSLRAHTLTLTTEKWETANNLDKAKVLNAALEERLRAEAQMALSDEQRAAQIEKHMEDQMAEIDKLDRELDESRRVSARCREELKALKTMEKDSVAGISRTKCRIAVFVKQNLDEDFLIQHRHLAEQEAIIDDLRHKLAEVQHIINVCHSNEARMLAMETAELSEVLEQKRKAAKILTNAVKETEDDARFLRKELETSEAQKRDLINKVDELRLVCTTKKEEQTRLGLTKEEKLVDYHIMKVEVQRERNLLYKRANDMQSLKTRKLDLQSVLKDRKLDCMLYVQSLEFQLRTAEQEKRTLRVELTEDLSKINVLKTRYEVMNHSKTASPVDYIIEAVEEREELQRKGDHLYAEICKVEQENERLKNTMEKFILDISAFERPLHEANEPSPEHQEALQLEQHLNRVERMVRLKNGVIQDLQWQFQDMKETSASLDQEAQGKEQELQLKQSVKTKLNKDISSQQNKIERVSIQMTKKIRSTKNTEAVNFEKDIELKMLKECNQSTMEQLKKAANANSELKELLEKSFGQAGVHVEFQG